MRLLIHKWTAGLSMALVTGMATAAIPGEYVYRPTPTSTTKAREFVENQKSFRLGFLPTEQSNPITASLERDFKRSFVDGVECLQRADRQVPIAMRHVMRMQEYAELVDAMETALRSAKGRIVFTGCGATGRLSILLESMWRDFFTRRAGELSESERRLADRVLSIMTAGDFALIKSVEFFEDYWEGGARQTDALGVGPGDVIIALNGGGECSTILGSVMRGVERGARALAHHAPAVGQYGAVDVGEDEPDVVGHGPRLPPGCRSRRSQRG
jgi:N-acetylmuramic acid 6-phosphate etherase